MTSQGGIVHTQVAAPVPLRVLVVVDGLGSCLGRSECDENIGIRLAEHPLLLQLPSLVHQDMQDSSRE